MSYWRKPKVDRLEIRWEAFSQRVRVWKKNTYRTFREIQDETGVATAALCKLINMTGRVDLRSFLSLCAVMEVNPLDFTERKTDDST